MGWVWLSSLYDSVFKNLKGGGITWHDFFKLNTSYFGFTVSVLGSVFGFVNVHHVTGGLTLLLLLAEFTMQPIWILHSPHAKLNELSKSASTWRCRTQVEVGVTCQ